MRITAEHVAKMEALLTTFEEEGGRSAIIKHDVNELTSLAGFVSVLRTVGVKVHSHVGRRPSLSARERRDFGAFLRAKRAAEAK